MADILVDKCETPARHADRRAALVSLLAELRTYARFLAPERAEADDLVQEALLRALGALAQFREGSNMRAWLFAILRNAFYEQARRRRTERAALAGQPREPDPAGPPSQDAHFEIADLQVHLFALPALQREALVLVGAQGMGYEEAAEICGVPVGTIKARVSRARAALARAMQRTAPQDGEG